MGESRGWRELHSKVSDVVKHYRKSVQPFPAGSKQMLHRVSMVAREMSLVCAHWISSKVIYSSELLIGCPIETVHKQNPLPASFTHPLSLSV